MARQGNQTGPLHPRGLEPPGARRGGARTWWVRAAAGLAVVVAAWAGTRHARPAVEAWLSQAVNRGIQDALRPWGGSGRVEGARLDLGEGVRLERVSLTFDRSVEVTAPEVALGVDVPAVLWAAGEPEQALRHIEASGIVIRPAPARAGEGHPPAGGAPDLREMVGSFRDAVLQLATGMSGALGGLVQPGESLTWELRGVWYATAEGPGRPFVTRGRLQASGSGQLVAEGDLELEGLGRVAGRLVGDAGRLEFSPLAFDQGGLTVRVSGTVTTGKDGELHADLDAEARPGLQSPVGGRARIRLRGPWPQGALPEAVVTLEAGEGGSQAPWWWPYLAGGSGQVKVVWDPEGVRLEEGHWRRGSAVGEFAGRIAYPAPHATRVEFRLSGLEPGADVPWWDAYRVGALDAAGELEGDWSGAWTLQGKLAASPGDLFGVAAGAASVQVKADLAERRLVFSQFRAPLGDGLLSGDGEVAWDEAASPMPDGRPAQVRLQARGRLQELAVPDLMQLAHQLGLWGQASPPAGGGGGPLPGAGGTGEGAGGGRPATPGARADEAAAASVTGALELDLAWVGGPGGRVDPVLVALGFDGADGSLGIRLRPDGAYRVESELVNLAGRALGPLLPGVSGFAAFSGELAGGRLSGTLTARHLSLRGLRLGQLSAPVELADGVLEADGATFTGGDVEGRADLRFGGDRPQVLHLKAQVTGGEAELALSASLELAIAPQATDLARVAVAVSGRPVATATGKLPVGWSSLDVGEPADVRVVMQEFPLELARRLLPGWEVEGGRISGEVALTGNLSAPRASGQVVASARRLQAPGFPGTLSEATVGVRIEDRRLTLTQARARTARDGRVTATGGAVLKSLWPVALDPVDMTATLQRAYFSGPVAEAVELSGAWSGSLRVEGAWGAGAMPKVSGRLSASGARLVLGGQLLPALLLAEERTPSAAPAGSGAGAAVAGPAVGREGGAGRAGTPASSAAPGAPATRPPGMPLEVDLVAEEPVALEVPAAGGSGYLDGELTLAGTSAQPVLEGELLLTQGRLQYFGREILVERGRLIFSRSGGLRPRLKLQAKTTGPEGPVTLTVEGDPQDARGLVVASDPPMAREQLAGLLLPPGGASGQSPGGGWVSRLNEQLVAWAMIPLQRAIREAFGLDEFWLTPMPEEQRWVVRLGKYLGPQRTLVRYGRTLGTGQAGQEVGFATRLGPGVDLEAGYSDLLGMRLGLSWEFQF